MSGAGPEPGSPRVWVLAGPLRGDNDQLVLLAEALGLGYRIDTDYPRGLSVLADRIAGARAARRHGAAPSWPDLVLLAGGRRVGEALAIKRASGGRTRLVCIGRPWADLDGFDLVVTTAQYCLPERPNVLLNTLTLNRPEPKALDDAAQHWREAFSHLPRPWIAVLAGGSSGSYAFGPATARRLAAAANAYARSHEGALLVTTSPRTPPAAADALREALEGPHVFHGWSRETADNPYLAYLALADRFVVTCDSASLLSEACATGRPVRLFTAPPRLRTRFLTALQRPLLPLLAGAIGAGLWLPARDMTRFHAGLRSQGLVEDEAGGLRGSGEVPDGLALAVRRIRALLADAPDARCSRIG